ncbi:MAG: hypothetical protein ACI4JQ_09390, partial [Ruminococcus sp.]
VASAAAMTATMAPAFAYEGVSASETALINSYSSENAQRIAAYCLENGMSLEETKELVDGYAERHPDTNLSRSSSSVDMYAHAAYYNPSAIATTDHYILAIVTDTTEALDEKFTFTFNPTYVTYGNMYALCGRYATDSQSMFVTNTATANKVISVLYMPNTTATVSADAAVKYKVNKVNATSERQLNAAISFTDNFGNGIVTYETYAVGDANHDGCITKEGDADFVLEYLTELRDDLSLIYTDNSTHYSAVTNLKAADANEDGIISLADVTRINSLANPS